MKSTHESLIGGALLLSKNVIAYSVTQKLSALYPGKAIIHGSGTFDWEDCLEGQQCKAEPLPGVLEQIVTDWAGKGKGLSHEAENGWYQVEWQGNSLEVLLLSWHTDGMGSCKSRYYWILGEDRCIAESFLNTLCEWNAVLRGEVLVFDNGHWQKSADLFNSIKSATFDNLVLQGSLAEEIKADFAQFFSSRDVYERYRIPWKRGVLFIGPPGNGKTHSVKALVNWLAQPCLYVKSFKARYATDHETIRDVFRQARETVPCILILEDLDSLINSKNRSFFLNELDGFAANTGIVVLATTNHPERLDPAILDRPSRFDRKYHFEDPAREARLAYLNLWNGTLDSELRLSEAGLPHIADATDGFSFAYLKELFLSSMMRWITAPGPENMDAVMLIQAKALREQMSSQVEQPSLNLDGDEEVEQTDEDD